MAAARLARRIKPIDHERFRLCCGQRWAYDDRPKEQVVKKLGNTTATLVALVVTAALAGPALAGFAAHSAVFSGSYTGTATEKVNGQTVTAAARGKGTGTLVGKSTITGTVVANTSDSPCALFGGPGVIAGAKGKLKVKILPTSRGCAASEEMRDNISLAGTVKVTGGTAKFSKARGTLRFSGRYNRSSGAFTVKLKGTLRY
jgi:hypothetical protein